MNSYADIFARVESVMQEQAKHFHKFEAFKQIQERHFTDAEYFDMLTAIVFYSGFRAETVSKKMNVIKAHFPDYESVTNYSDQEISDIMSDHDMIKNERKILGCFNNARLFKGIIRKFGSFQEYVSSFRPKDSFENLMLLKEELAYKFDYLGGITAYHFLTDVGLPVLKPDRVIARIFKRIGLIESEKQLLKTVIQGRKFAEATNHPIRYIDIIFVKYGQMGQDREFGLEDGMCLEKKPKCAYCRITDSCNFVKI